MRKLIPWSLLSVLLLAMVLTPAQLWAVGCGVDGDPDIPQPRELPRGKLVPIDGDSDGFGSIQVPEQIPQAEVGTAHGRSGQFERGSSESTLLGLVLSFPWWLVR